MMMSSGYTAMDIVVRVIYVMITTITTTRPHDPWRLRKCSSRYSATPSYYTSLCSVVLYFILNTNLKLFILSFLKSYFMSFSLILFIVLFLPRPIILYLYYIIMWYCRRPPRPALYYISMLFCWSQAHWCGTIHVPGVIIKARLWLYSITAM